MSLVIPYVYALFHFVCSLKGFYRADVKLDSLPLDKSIIVKHQLRDNESQEAQDAILYPHVWIH